MKKEKLIREFKKHYRLLENSAAGKNFFEVKVVSDRRNVRAERQLEEESIHHYFNWVANNARFFINVSKQNSIPIKDGIINLYSKYLMRKNGVSIYDATWIHQSSGTAIETKSGLIATLGDTAFHLEGRINKSSIEKAIAGVFRKQNKNKQYAKAIKKARIEEKKQGVSFVSKIPEKLTLTLAKAQAVGHCLPGIEKFCNALSLDINKKYNARKVWSELVHSRYYKKYEHDLKLVIYDAIRKAR